MCKGESDSTKKIFPFLAHILFVIISLSYVVKFALKNEKQRQKNRKIAVKKGKNANFEKRS